MSLTVATERVAAHPVTLRDGGEAVASCQLSIDARSAGMGTNCADTGHLPSPLRLAGHLPLENADLLVFVRRRTDLGLAEALAGAVGDAERFVRRLEIVHWLADGDEEGALCPLLSDVLGSAEPPGIVVAQPPLQ